MATSSRFLDDALFRLLQQDGWTLSYGPDIIVIQTPRERDAITLIKRFVKQLQEWLVAFNLGRTDVREILVKYAIPANGRPFRIIRKETPLMSVQEIRSIPDLEVPSLWLCPSMAKLLLELMEHPERKYGLVRVRDEQQILFSPNCQDLNPGHSMDEALTWKRPDFWHPEDLRVFNRDTHQQLEPDNPASTIQYTWRSFDPELGLDADDGWLSFTTEYRLVRDAYGDLIHIGRNMGMDEIRKPVLA